MKEKFNIRDLIRPNILDLRPYSSARDEFDGMGSGMTFLDANENPFNTGLNRYPDPRQKKLKLEIERVKDVSKANIFLGNGSDEILDLLFRAFCEPAEDNIITMPPTYGMYEVLASINNIENRQVLLTTDFQPDISEVLAQQDSRTKLLFICSPNNPSGNTMASDKIELLLSGFHGLVIIDEAYIDFTEKESWLRRLDEFPNLVIVQTFSKAFGMAGIRLGMCFAGDTIISVLNSIKPPYNVNELTQKQALLRLKKMDIIRAEVSLLNEEKTRMRLELETIDFVNHIFPSDANFLLLRVDDATLRYEQLCSEGIVVRNRSKQPLCENTLRITVGTPRENDKLINTLKLL